MSFADLFARYREMGVMGPQPFDEHGILFNEAENAWTYSVDSNSKDALVIDDGGEEQEHTTFKPSRAFLLTPESDYVKVSSDEEFEELVSSPHRLGLNLSLLKNNNVCKEYYKLTSNVLRSLIVGIKEITTDEITPVWQVGFPCTSPKKLFSNLLVDKLNEDTTYKKLTSFHNTEEVGISKLCSLSYSSKLPMREVVNIANLRRWLSDQIGHPVSYMSTSLVHENGITNEVIKNTTSLDSQGQTTLEIRLIPEEIPYKGPEQVTSSTKLVDSPPEVESIKEATTMVSIITSESVASKTNEEIPTHSNSSKIPQASATKDDEASTKTSINFESDHESPVRKSFPINRTASGNKQFRSSRQSEDDEEKPRINDANSMPARKYSIPVECKPGKLEQQTSSNKTRHTIAVTRNKETIMPVRSRSWCLVGGYVKRFPAKHQNTSRKIQPPSKSQPQVPLAA